MRDKEYQDVEKQRVYEIGHEHGFEQASGSAEMFSPAYIKQRHDQFKRNGNAGNAYITGVRDGRELFNKHFRPHKGTK